MTFTAFVVGFCSPSDQKFAQDERENQSCKNGRESKPDHHEPSHCAG